MYRSAVVALKRYAAPAQVETYFGNIYARRTIGLPVSISWGIPN